MRKKMLLIIPAMVILLMAMVSCGLDTGKSDAYGNFESNEVLVSAEMPGKIIWMKPEEGDVLKAGDTICVVDTIDLVLKREVLQAQKAAIHAKLSGTEAQAAVYRQQKENLLVDRNRFARLVQQKAATQKQLDDIDAGIRLAEKQMATSLSANQSIMAELGTIDKQLAQVEESVSKCIVRAPTGGTVLEKYVEAGELAVTGKPLCKIADVSSLYLRAYIDGARLGKVKNGDKVQVLVDKDKSGMRSLSGVVTWISTSAEFTPKIIQTRDERVDLVYAFKVKVENPDGSLKIAMPGEVKLNTAAE